MNPDGKKPSQRKSELLLSFSQMRDETLTLISVYDKAERQGEDLSKWGADYRQHLENELRNLNEKIDVLEKGEFVSEFPFLDRDDS